MAVKINSSGRIPVVFSGGKYKLFQKLCCPIESTILEEENCCECVYSFNVSAPVAAGCGDSTYYPNRCQPLNFQTPAITIGPLKFIAEISAGPGGITVDDELIVNGQIFQPGLYPVQPSNQCPSGLCPGSTGFGTSPNCVQFSGGPSACNGQHTIPEGTVIGVIPEGETMTIAGGDNHGIDLFMLGQIKIKPIAAP
jgi:hypothetical protein